MAHSKRSLTQQMEEELSCAVCCELYTCPLLLKCSHTFCKKCIQDLVRNSNLGQGYGVISSRFRCPVCRAHISLKSARGIDDLPENLALANLIAMLKSSEEIKTLFAKKEVPPLEIPKCAWHPDSDCTVDSFCVDCLKVYCHQSVPQTCYDHDLKKSETLWADTWKRVHRLMNEAGEKMSSLIDRVHLLDDHLVAIEHQESSAKSELKAEIDILQSMLKSRLAQLNTEIHREVQGMRYPVVHDREECSQQLEEIEAGMRNIEKLQESNNGIRSIRNLLMFEQALTNQLSENAPKLLNRSIPVVTMPTWKLLRENTETSIRTLITRRTGPFPSPPSSRARALGSSTSIKTSGGKPSCWTDSLPTDVTMKSSPSNQGINNSASKLWPQATAAFPSSRVEKPSTISRSSSSVQVVPSKNQNNSARGAEEIHLRRTALRPSAQVNEVTSVLRGSESSRSMLQQIPSASSLSFTQATGPQFLASTGDSGRIFASPQRRSTGSRRSGSVSASGITASQSTGSKDNSLHFRTSLSNNMDSIISSLKKIEVKVDEWDIHANKKVKKKNTRTEFKDFGTTVPNTFKFGSSDQSPANSAFVFGSSIDITQKVSPTPGQSQVGVPLAITQSNSLFKPSPLASKSSTGKPATTSNGGFSIISAKNQEQTSSAPLFGSFSLTNPFNIQSNPFSSTSSSNSLFSFTSTQTRSSAAPTTGLFSSSMLSAGNTTPSTRRPNKKNKPKSNKGKESPNFFLDTSKIEIGNIWQNSLMPSVVGKKEDQTKGLPFASFSFGSNKVEEASEVSSLQSSVLSIEDSSGSRSESVNESQSPLGSFLARRMDICNHSKDGQDTSIVQDDTVDTTSPPDVHLLEEQVTDPVESNLDGHGQKNERLGQEDSGEMNEFWKSQTESREFGNSHTNEETEAAPDTVLDDCSSAVNLERAVDFNAVYSLGGEYTHPEQGDFVSSVPNNSNSRTAPVMSAVVAQSHQSPQNSSVISADRTPFRTVCQDQNSGSSFNPSSVSQIETSQHGEAKLHTSTSDENIIQEQGSAATSKDSLSLNLSSFGNQEGHNNPVNGTLSGIVAQEDSSASARPSSFSFSQFSKSSKGGVAELANDMSGRTITKDQFSFKLTTESSEEKPTFKFGESGKLTSANFSFQPTSTSSSSTESFRNSFSNLFRNSTSDSHSQLSFGFPPTSSAFGEEPGSGFFQFGKKVD